MRIHYLILLLAFLVSCGHREYKMPHTDRTRGLVKELLSKLDSTDVYAARKERVINSLKAGLPGKTDRDRVLLNYNIAKEYSDYVVDSTLIYLQRASRIAGEAGLDSLKMGADIMLAILMEEAGFYSEAREIISSVPRKAVSGKLLENYYNAWALLYHNLYSDFNEPDSFEKKYRESYNVYRDSLLSVADTMSILYLHNIERKAARLGDFAEARRYNDIRLSSIKDRNSAAYATCLYDRFMIAYYYERNLTGEAVDDLLESAIIEVSNSKQDIASLLRVEALLIGINEVNAAKKVSDYYFSSLQRLGSRRRLIDGADVTIKINDRNSQLIRKRNRELQSTLVLISLLLFALVFALVNINRSRIKITRLKDNLEQSYNITKNYIGVVFQLYSSYIKRLDVFRMRVHTRLKKGQIEQALELTSPLGDIASVERKELFHNFDTAFVDIFPDFLQTVNGCLKPEARIVPKKTEILSTELRILALIKLGIEDSTRIAEMLQCSVKTVYNHRSGLKSRLAVTEEEFEKVISEL